MTNSLLVCVQREGERIRLTIELPEGGISVLMPPAEFDCFLSLGATVFTGVEEHVHMDVSKTCVGVSALQAHDLN